MPRDTQTHTFILVSLLVLYCIGWFYNTITVQNTSENQKQMKEIRKDKSLYAEMGFCIYVGRRGGKGEGGRGANMFAAQETIVIFFLFCCCLFFYQ